MKIIINKSHHKLPEYTTENSAGMDLWAIIHKDIFLRPNSQGTIDADYRRSGGFAHTGKH